VLTLPWPAVVHSCRYKKNEQEPGTARDFPPTHRRASI
jgi:hypothetical protein